MAMKAEKVVEKVKGIARDSIIKRFKKSADIKVRFANEQADTLLEAASLITECLRQGNKVLIFGNGGSAADSQHIAAELVNRMLLDRDALPALALTTDSSVITSIANDYGYAQIFAKQVQALGRPGDIAWGISTSGSSENVVLGLEAASAAGLKTIGMTGKPGSNIEQLVDLCLSVDFDYVPCIQEVHITVGHVICELVEAELFGKKAGT